MKRKLLITGIALAAILITNGNSKAGLISINTSTLSGNGAEITSLGNVIYAWNVNGGFGDTPMINGITFTDPQPADISISTWGFGGSNFGTTGVHYTGDMPDLMKALEAGAFTTNETVTIGGLTPGIVYQTQFTHHQDINNADFRTMEVHFGTTAGTGGGVVNPSDNQGYITTALFSADSASQLFTFRVGGNDRALLNSVSVTTFTPEPSTSFLSFLGLMSLALLRRRRRRNRG